MFLSCDKEISRYYRWLAGRSNIKLISQRHDSHISVIRTEELRPSQVLPEKFNNVQIEFCSNPEYIQFNERHYWFRIISPQLEDIRTELDFSNQPVEIVEGKIITHPFHLTIGRIDGKI